MVTYKESGVDVAKGEALVERIKEKVKGTYGPEVVQGIGGFCALYDLGDGRYLASGTDGVGTKIKLAQDLGNHQTVGIDLVAMCANDILCCGARPLFFLDYLATGKLDLAISEALIDGITQGCREAGMPLLGGETAEMPGLYQEGEYDLAGFCVGEVKKENLIDGKNIKEGDVVLGLSSSGFHSNGFSLLRRLILPQEKFLANFCLTPTRLYVEPVLQLLQKFPGAIKGMAHITGGGMRNILRINPQWGYHLNSLPSISELPPAWEEVCTRSQLSWQELYSTFNMGIGFVMVVDSEQSQSVQTYLRERHYQHQLWPLGFVIPQPHLLSLSLGGSDFHFHENGLK